MVSNINGIKSNQTDSVLIRTTLYEMVEAVEAEINPGEESLVSTIILRMLEKSSFNGSLNPC